MSRREDKETSKRRSELEEYEDRYYQELKGRSIRINVSDSLYKCPFCRSAQRRDYCYEDLLKHASRISRDSKGISTKEIGKHLALERYLRKYFSRKVNAEDSTNIGLSSAKNDQQLRLSSAKNDHQLRLSSAKNDQQLRLSSAKNDQQFVWPWMGVIANIKTEVKDGRFVGESGTKLKEELEKKGFNPVRVQPLWNYRGHSGLAVVEFNKDWVGFCNAIAFEKSYETERRGRRDFYVSKDRGDKPFGWLAYDDDYYSKGILGDHLRKKGHLRTLSDKEAEEQRKRSMLVADLQKTLEIKNSRLLEMESKYNETKHSLDNLVTQKDEMLRAHNEGIMYFLGNEY